jgi:hypothetical protein
MMINAEFTGSSSELRRRQCSEIVRELALSSEFEIRSLKSPVSHCTTPGFDPQFSELC